jgi:hypothetical protein
VVPFLTETDKSASWNFGREREGSGDVGCLGDAETAK